MLTGLRRAGTAVPNRLSQTFSKVLTVRARELGSEYEALSYLSKEKANLKRVYSRKSREVAEVYLRDHPRFNILTAKMMKDLEDNMEWMEFDGYMRFIRIQSDDPALFSQGTDLKLIQSALADGNLQVVVDYLQSLQDFAMYVTGYNKPAVLELEGQISNSAAAIFLSMPWVNLKDPKATVWFNEMTKGSPLLGGSSYVLSRMPRGVGRFIALTSPVLKGADLWNLNLVNMKLDFDPTTLKVMEDSFLHLPRFREVSLVHKLPQYIQLRDSLVREGLLPTQINREFQNDFKNSDPRSALVKAVTHDMLIRHANQLEQTTNIGTWAQRYQSIQQTGILPTIENRYGTVEKFVMSQVRSGQGMFGFHSYTHQGEISGNLADIANYFSEGDFKTIKQNLERSNSKWAKEALTKLEHCDPKLADVMLSTLDFAEENDYVTCLVNEYHTALSYYASFADGGFSRVSTEYSPRSPPKALLPVRDYVMEFPDAVRMALNNTSNSDPFVNKNFGETVRTFLNMQGIDILNPVTNMDVVREVLWRRKKNQLDIQREKDRLAFLGQNAVAKKTFVNSRKAAIEELLSDPKKATKEINTEMMNAFNQKFGNFQTLVGARSRTANMIQRRDQIKRLRQVATDAFLTTDPNQRNEGLTAMGPLEILEDPMQIPDRIMEKYLISQKASKLVRKRNFTPDAVRSYLKGTATIYDLYEVLPADPSDTMVHDYNINRGLQLSWNIEYDRVYTQEYKMRLLLLGTEDEREVSFREGYSEELLQFIERIRNEDMDTETKVKIIQEMKDKYFDCMNGTGNPFEYQDPRNFEKAGETDVRDVLMVHRALKKSANPTDFPVEIFNELNHLIDIQMGMLAPKAFTAVDSDKLESRHLKPVRNGLADGTILEDVPKEELWKHNKILEFKSYQENLLKSGSAQSDGVQGTDGLESFVYERVQDNDYLKARLGFLRTTENDPELQQSEVQRMVSKILRDRFFDQIKKELATRFGDLPALISESPVMLKGFGSDANRFAFVNGIDYYLLKNLQLDSFEMWAPNVFTAFCDEVLQDLEEGFEKITDQPVYETKYRNQADWGKPRRRALNEFIKEFLGGKGAAKSKGAEIELTKAQINEAALILERVIFDLVELLGYYEGSRKKVSSPQSNRFRGVVEDPDPKPSKQFHKHKKELEEQAEEELEKKRRAEHEQAWLQKFKEEHETFCEALLTKGDPTKLFYMDQETLMKDNKKLPTDVDYSHLFDSYVNEKQKLEDMRDAELKSFFEQNDQNNLKDLANQKESYQSLIDFKTGSRSGSSKGDSSVKQFSLNSGNRNVEAAPQNQDGVDEREGFVSQIPKGYRSEYRVKRIKTDPTPEDPLQKDALALEPVNNRKEMELHQFFLHGDEDVESSITPYTRLRDALKLARDFEADTANLELSKDEHQAQVKLSLLELANMKHDKETTREEIDNLIATYQGYIGALADRKRLLREGPINLIFELETVLKRMNEGEFSGVDDDFSAMENLLKENVVERKQTPEAWVRTKLKDYFATLFSIREKAEKDFNHSQLIMFDVKLAEFFSVDNVRQVLLSELDKDLLALDFIRVIDTSKKSVELGIARDQRTPKLMAFTLKHRIQNTLAFKHYRALFMQIQSMEIESSELPRKPKDRMRAEVEILKVHLERLFKESQEPPSKSLPKQAEAPTRQETPMTDTEDYVRMYSSEIAKSFSKISSTRQSKFGEEVTAEVDKLIARMKIYGLTS